MTPVSHDRDGARRADQVAAWATGAGIGFIAFMVTWLTANRVADLLWEPPVGPVAAILLATIVGFLVALVGGRRLAIITARESSRRVVPKKGLEQVRG